MAIIRLPAHQAGQAPAVYRRDPPAVRHLCRDHLVSLSVPRAEQ